MNYFGHAVIAVRKGGHPGFVLGAMLPDLATMAGARADATFVKQLPPSVQEGVRFHHATDSVFHETPTFTAWNQRALAALSSLGVRRGPARAMAHMGVEFSFDAQLARLPGAEEGYLSALAYGATLSFPPATGTSPSGRTLAQLLCDLGGLGVSVHTQEASRYRLRFSRALSGRARLEPTEDELGRSVQWFSELSLGDALPELLGELEKGLSLLPSQRTSGP